MWEPVLNWFFDSGNQQLLLGIIIAFLVGSFLGSSQRRLKEDKAKLMSGNGYKAFFKGVQYILSNDHDQAIEEFTKSVQVNSDTIETYVALGNLYRSKGDIDRAIRIRQTIILRPNLDETIKLRALFDLGLDYRKGGFLNRALKTFQKVIQRSPSDVETLEEIERIYEELRDWENAYRTRQKIARLVKDDHHHILAHHLVEMGKVQQQNGAIAKAVSLFNKAISTHRGCVDAYLHLGDLYFAKQAHKKAISSWKRIATVAPQYNFLAYRRLEGAYSKMKNLRPIEDFLKKCAKDNPDVFTHMALARYLYNAGDVEGALGEIGHALELNPAFWEARKFKGEILLSHGREKDALHDYKAFIAYLNAPYLKFQCAQCGLESKGLHWQCPQCRKWDTIHLIDTTGPQSSVAPESKADGHEAADNRQPLSLLS